MSDDRDDMHADRGDARVPIITRSVELLGRGFRPYERHHFEMAGPDGSSVTYDRDLLRAGEVVGTLPIDFARQEIVLIRQFRLAAHLATGRGELVEIAAGRVDPGESARDAARRECREEIGLTPLRAARIMTFLVAPAFSDELMSLWLAEVDARALPALSGHADEGEIIQPFALSIDDALASLARGIWHNAPLIVALQWLGLNRDRLETILQAGDAHA